MSFVSLMWIIVIILVIRFVILYRLGKNPHKLKRANNSILFFGSLAFLIGIYGQMTGLMAAFDTIQKAGTNGVPPGHIVGGIKVTFIVPSFGMMLLIISVIIWYIFRSLKKYPSPS